MGTAVRWKIDHSSRLAIPAAAVAGRAERDEESLSPRPGTDYAGRDRQRAEDPPRLRVSCAGLQCTRLVVPVPVEK